MPEQVRVGQVWADNDWRSKGRTFRIVRIVNAHALVVVLTARDNADNAERRRAVGARRTIRLDRFAPTPTGYRLVSEPSGVDDEGQDMLANWADDAAAVKNEAWCEHHEAPGSCTVYGCGHHSVDSVQTPAAGDRQQWDHPRAAGPHGESVAGLSDPGPDRVQGSCWDRAPELVVPDGHAAIPSPWCELPAGHLGAHRSGSSQWLIRGPGRIDELASQIRPLLDARGPAAYDAPQKIEPLLRELLDLIDGSGR